MRSGFLYRIWQAIRVRGDEPPIISVKDLRTRYPELSARYPQMNLAQLEEIVVEIEAGRSLEDLRPWDG
jgi:hypothetical protein